MGSESSLWRAVSKNMQGRWIAERMENLVASGTPDVYFTLVQCGTMGWLELKHAHEWPKKPKTPLKIKHYTKEQKAFIKRHGYIGANIFVLLQVEKEYFLNDWGLALRIGTLTRDQLKELSLGYWMHRVDYTEFTVLLRNSKD